MLARGFICRVKIVPLEWWTRRLLDPRVDPSAFSNCGFQDLRKKKKAKRRSQRTIGRFNVVSKKQKGKSAKSSVHRFFFLL